MTIIQERITTYLITNTKLCTNATGLIQSVGLNGAKHGCERNQQMTDNEKLALWQHGYGYRHNTADYLNDSTASMSLLDTLVEKGYTFTLFSELHDNKFFGCCVWEHESSQWTNPAAESFNKPTPREAVVAACLELIEEDV